MGLVLRLSILILIIFVVEFYFVKKVLSTIKNIFPSFDRSKLKKITQYFVLFINLFPLIGIGYMIFYEVTGIRPSFPPDNLWFDIFIQFPFWLFVLWMVQCFLFFLPIDILRIITFPFYKSKREKLRGILFKVQLVLLVFFLAYNPVRSLYDYLTVSVRIVEYKKENLPKALEGFKLVLSADVQADRYTNPWRLQKFIDNVNGAHPDLVLIAGDVVTSTPQFVDEAAQFLGKIESKYGVYACIGDHDNWVYRNNTEKSLKVVESALAKQNIEMIDNKKKLITVNNSKIGIAFVTNNYVHSIDRRTLDTLSNIQSNLDLKIFLTHQPREFLIDEAKEKNYDLFLAGHTHGGQITFLFPFYNLSPTLFETKYVRGDFHFGNMLAVVTRGLGMSLVPLRLNSTPEVTVIVLERK